MNLSSLTEQELRAEFKMAISKYIHLLRTTPKEDIWRQTPPVVNDYIGTILEELKKRRKEANQ